MPTPSSPPPGPIPFDGARLRRLAATVEARLGIKMPDTKLTMLHGRLQRRLHQLGLASVAAYEARLADPQHADAEHVELFDLATTNKTDFFREAAHFTLLADEVLPRLADGRASWHARVWCVGCSTGQEVYSLAMVLDDHAQRNPGFAYSIHATDISTRVLREAARATYASELVAPVPPHLRARYLMRGRDTQAGRVRVVPELRARVRFARLNLMDASYDDVPGNFDLVFFRNVLIYFDRPTQRAVVDRICGHARRGAYLFIGHSESLTGQDLPLAQVGTSVFEVQP